MACRPCYDGRDFAACRFNECMYEITVSQVLRELDHLLEARSHGETAPWRIVFADRDAPHVSTVNLMEGFAVLKPQKDNRAE